MPLAVSSDEPPPRPTSESMPSSRATAAPVAIISVSGFSPNPLQITGRMSAARRQRASFRVPRGHDAGVGGQQGPAEAELPGQLSKAVESAVAEDDAGAELDVEGRHPH